MSMLSKTADDVIATVMDLSRRIGKVPERAVDVNGEGLIYVRRDGEDQTWLARGRLPLHKQAIDWLDTRFIDIPREEVARVTLWAGTERPVVMERGSPGAADFEIVNMPETRASRGAPVVNKVAGSLFESSFDDVAPAEVLGQSASESGAAGLGGLAGVTADSDHPHGEFEGHLADEVGDGFAHADVDAVGFVAHFFVYPAQFDFQLLRCKPSGAQDAETT
jgi:hypothetical protein